MTLHDLSFLDPGWALWILLGAGVLALLWILRGLGLGRRDSTAKPPPQEPTTFVIETFGDLLQQLREKEDLLESLRAQAEARAQEAEATSQHLREEMEARRHLTLLGEVAVSIAHEFRNALGTILGYTRILEEELPDHPEARACLEAIRQEMATLDRMIQDLLQYGRPLEIHPTWIPLDVWIPQVVEAHRQALGMGSIRYQVQVNADKTVYWDSIWMGRALDNLLRNAVEAMPQGGTVSLTVELQGEAVHLRVQDQGEGIPPEHLSRIFLPFFTTRGRGSGMGLPLVQKVVLAHGGQIRVQSRPGEGTTFLLTLPRQASEEAGTREASHVPRPLD